MKRVYAIAALLAVLSCGTAFAVTDVQNGSSTRGVQQGRLTAGLGYADSSGQVPGVDPTLHAWYVSEQDKDRDHAKLWEDIFGPGTNLAVGTADSTAQPIDVRGYAHFKLLLKIIPRAGSPTGARVAIQFRDCMSGIDDSLHTYAEYQYGSTSSATATALPDTINVGHLVTGSLTAAWSGEIVVTFANNRNAATSNTFSYPSGVALNLDSMFGREVRFRYLSIRLRNISTTAPGIDYKVSLEGFAQ